MNKERSRDLRVKEKRKNSSSCLPCSRIKRSAAATEFTVQEKGEVHE